MHPHTVHSKYDGKTMAQGIRFYSVYDTSHLISLGSIQQRLKHFHFHFASLEGLLGERKAVLMKHSVKKMSIPFRVRPLFASDGYSTQIHICINRKFCHDTNLCRYRHLESNISFQIIRDNGYTDQEYIQHTLEGVIPRPAVYFLTDLEVIYIQISILKMPKNRSENINGL